MTSQPAAMVSCPHYSSLCLSVVFSFCLGLSLTRRSSLALSLSLARARSLLLEGSSTFVPSRTPLASQPAGMVSCSHPLSSSLPISGSLSLCLCLCPSLFQVCLRLVLPGARRTARSNTCHAGLARSPVGAAPAQQAVQRCARTAGCAALLSHATMAQGPSQTDLAQRALLGASPPWSCQRGAGRPAPDSRGPPPP